MARIAGGGWLKGKAAMGAAPTTAWGLTVLAALANFSGCCSGCKRILRHDVAGEGPGDASWRRPVGSGDATLGGQVMEPAGEAGGRSSGRAACGAAACGGCAAATRTHVTEAREGGGCPLQGAGCWGAAAEGPAARWALVTEDAITADPGRDPLWGANGGDPLAARIAVLEEQALIGERGGLK